jgi:hypothetical protein
MLQHSETGESGFQQASSSPEEATPYSKPPRSITRCALAFAAQLPPCCRLDKPHASSCCRRSSCRIMAKIGARCSADHAPF